MFENLQIRNYRIFKEFKIDRLRRINLIAGRNNSGKTSLLEAIFLLSGAGNANMATNANVMRMGLGQQSETLWKPIFSDLDMSRSIEIDGYHTSHGQLTLEITSGRQPTEIPYDYALALGNPAINIPDELALRFQYSGPTGTQVKSRIHVQDSKIISHQSRINVPFIATLLQARSANSREDAIQLARLRKQKRDHLLLEALQVVEPKLQSIEDNSSSGTPMIWGDIGLSELIPLAIMGEGMTRIAQLILAIASVADGVALVDEVETGIHHSVLPKVWQVVDTAAKQFRTQVFATTHSLECIRAAHESLGADDFRLHRLEATDTMSRCVTYDPDSIRAALLHDLEVR